MSEDKVLIVGGGFGALAAAVALHKVGVPSLVLEKSRHARSEGFSIGTFTNGWRALQELGVADGLRSEHFNLQGIVYYNPDGSVITDFKMTDVTPPPYRAEHEMRVVMREAIPRYLTAQLPPGAIQYDANVVDVNADAKGAEVTLEGGKKLRGRFVVVADGVHSKTAAKFHKAKLEYMHHIGWRAIVEIDAEEPVTMPKASLAQGPGVRIGFMPVKHDVQQKKALFYWFMARSARDDEDFGTPEQQKEEMKALVKGWTVGNFQQLLEATPASQIKLSKVYQRQVVAGQPWFEGCMTGVGDACHATTPFLAQGGSMALESGVELGVHIKKAMQQAGGVPFAELPPEALCPALREYEIVRSRRVAYIITKSRNFGAGFRKRSWLVMLLMRLGLIKPLVPIDTATFLEHANWEPSGPLEEGAPKKVMPHVEE